jgi:hypothetical protein
LYFSTYSGNIFLKWGQFLLWKQEQSLLVSHGFKQGRIDGIILHISTSNKCHPSNIIHYAWEEHSDWKLSCFFYGKYVTP